MIQNPAILEPNTQPEREIIVHRESEIDSLISVLKPLPTGEFWEASAYLYGPSGAGKTTTTRCVLEQLEEAHDVSIIYIDCMAHHSQHDILNAMLEGLGARPSAFRRGESTGSLYSKVKASTPDGTIVVLDEVDQLETWNVLHQLYGLNGVSTVCIANQPWHDLEFEDPRIDSRMGSATQIAFRAYSESQLTSILDRRVRAGLDAGVIGNEEISTIVSYADGDARKAISLLNQAVRRTRKDRLGTVSSDVIEASVGDAEREIVRSRLDSLSADQRVALEVIGSVGPSTSTPLFEAYCERVDEPKSDRTFRNWLRKFVEYELVDKTDSSVPEYQLRKMVGKELRESLLAN
ncbi:Cdc6/Cdc18 family protein [Natronosalvus amylolyticus]|uniref:Cdc6/Cdc18 family protein n=1 Tax=Natronosalvus amylolyticus TaxID=2961994 RepID=UPI0020C9736F|nr:Cdc6/Cdc18 family protein [Natronosalvus amylolyticus]